MRGFPEVNSTVSTPAGPIKTRTSSPHCFHHPGCTTYLRHQKGPLSVGNEMKKTAPPCLHQRCRLFLEGNEWKIRNEMKNVLIQHEGKAKWRMWREKKVGSRGYNFVVVRAVSIKFSKSGAAAAVAAAAAIRPSVRPVGGGTFQTHFPQPPPTL